MFSQPKRSILERARADLWQGFAMSHVGTVRQLNEDAFFIDSVEVCGQHILFALVCDGLGGLEKGDLASGWIMTGLSDYWYKAINRMELLELSIENVIEGLEHELRVIHDEMREFAAHQRIVMGSTCTAVLIWNDEVRGLHVGDSRIYHYNKRLDPMTRDDSWIQDQVDKGRISYQTSLTHPKRHILTQCVGGQEGLQINRVYGNIEKAKALFLCTDGIYNACEEDELVNCCKSSRSGKEALEKLFDSILDRGADDNITAVLIKKNKKVIWPFRV